MVDDAAHDDVGQGDDDEADEASSAEVLHGRLCGARVVDDRYAFDDRRGLSAVYRRIECVR